jgi:thiamine-phosphate pyrophosphorylase
MTFDKENLLLYAVTDRSWLKGRSLSSQVEETIKGGTTLIQLREKEMNEEEFLIEALEIKELCNKYRVPLLINDNVDIALAIDADGVHVGQQDMEACDVRQRIGRNKILGVSAQTVDQAIEAQRMGADYLGVGAVFPTGTKTDAQDVSYATLEAICAAVNIPVVAIGGIGKHNILKLKGSGISGAAVVSAIFAQPDIRKATSEMKELISQMLN